MQNMETYHSGFIYRDEIGFGVLGLGCRGLGL